MNSMLQDRVTPSSPNAACAAPLARFGLLRVTGDDARAFLHAQLTNDIQHMPADNARLAGWCSAKGRLLASFLVIPQADGFLLQLSRDLLAGVAKRLAMFVLRAKVKIVDASDDWAQIGLWGPGAAARLATLGISGLSRDLALGGSGELLAVRLGEQQYLLLARASSASDATARLEAVAAEEEDWSLLEIRAGRPIVQQATQDLFVPQMVNLHAIGGVDFRKGCYPGQEIVARAQYRGQVKRRMIRARAPGSEPLREGQDLFTDGLPGQASGTVVNVARAGADSELLAVVPIGALEQQAAIRAAPAGEPLEVLPLPYAQ